MFSPLFLNILFKMKKEARNLKKLKRLLFLSHESDALKKVDSAYSPKQEYRKEKIVNNNQQSAGTKDHAISRISNTSWFHSFPYWFWLQPEDVKI